MAPPLDEYRKKRIASATPEPFGGKAGARPRLFVVQKHAARRLHYDFRLELGGVLVSWAVPRGPSLDPAEKRLAVHVEDHPVEYADFEGIIPEGNYGAGAVIVWDQGSWVDLEDAEEGLRKGKLLFELRGHKLRGVWTLVRTKKRGQETTNEWLLIKHQDEWARADADATLPQESIFSGLTLEQLREGKSPAQDLVAELKKRKAPRGDVDASEVPIMLAELRDQPFTAPGWLFELKYDGFRVLADKRDGRVALYYRRGSDARAIYPEIARAIEALPYARVTLDGEVCVLDEQGRPSFQRLQKRAQLSRASDIERGAVDFPAVLYVFDLLAFEGYDVRPLPLAERKPILRKILPRAGPLKYADHIDERGVDLFAEIRRHGLEGIVAKKCDAPYRAGRSPDWLKIRIERTGDFVVVGWTDPQGARAGIGALHLACWEAGGLVYVGRVGTGFSEKQLDELSRTLVAVKKPPCSGPIPTGRGHHFCKPELICEVRYREFTEDLLLRQPVFLRFRDDKTIEDCIRGDAPAGAREPIVPEAAPPPQKKVVFSNLDKVFFPDDGYTKGDLIAYHRRIAPWLLPYLRDRPIVLTRYPDGIAGKSFFQKDAPGFVPGWVRTERIWSEQAEREIDYFIVGDVESLLYIVNMGTIPLHVWSSRVQSIGQPDWTILDLDPKEAPFEHVWKLALAIRELCDELELPSYVKTSGQKGMHVLVPLGKQLTYEQSRGFAQLLAQVIVDEHPDIATVARHIPSRGGRVYVDFGQNGHGRTIVGPYSVRPQPGAPVSATLRWSEVGKKLDPRKFTIKTMPRRMEKLGEDPFAGVLVGSPDLARALERLGERLKAGK